MKKPRARNVLILLLAGLVLLAAEGFFILRAGLLNDQLVRAGLGLAHRSLLGRITVGAVEGDPLSGLVIRNFTLRGPDGQLIAAASEATVDFSLLRLLRRQSPAAVRVTHAFFHAEKRDGRWNLHRLRRPKPPNPKRKPRNYPPLVTEARVESLHLIISPSVERVYDASVRVIDGRVWTLGRNINYSVTDFAGVLDTPRLGINGLTGEGSAHTAPRGWDLGFKHCRAVTASSIIELETGSYNTGVSAVAARFNRLEIAPDVLSVFWPGHQLAVPVVGEGKVSGTTSRPSFALRIASEAGDLNAVGYYDRAKNHVDLKGDLYDFSLARFLVKPIPLENMTGGFTLTWERRRAPAPSPQPGATTAPAGATVTAAVTQPGSTTGPERLFRAHLELLDFTYPGVNSFPGLAEIEFRDDEWALGVSSEMPGTDFAAYLSGRTTAPKPLSVRAVLRGVNPRLMRRGWPDGRLVGVLQIDGFGTSLNNFRGTAAAELDAGMIYGSTLSSADLHASVNAGRINFRDSAVAASGLSVRGNGWIEPTRPTVPFSFDLDAAGRNPRLVSRLTRGAVDAPGVSARLALSGNRYQWRARGAGGANAIKTSKAETAAATVQLDLASRAGRIEGTVDFRTERLTIPSANWKSIKIPPMTVALHAEVPPSPLRRPVIRFRLDSSSEAGDYDLDGAGQLAVAGGRDWRLDLDALALRVAGRDWNMPAPSVFAVDAAGLLIQDFKLKSGAERLAADGRLRRGDFNLTLAAQSVNLSPWARVFQYGDTVGGVMDLAVVATGAPDTPVLTGAIAVEHPVYRSVALDRLAGDLGYGAGRFTFGLTGKEPSAGQIEAAGFIPMRLSFIPGAFAVPRDQPIEVGITAGEVDAGLIAIILPSLTDIDGRMSVDAKLLGTIDAPAWNGTAKVRDMSFKVPSWGLRMEDVSGNAEIVNNRVTIPGLTGRSGDGKAGLSGSLQLAAFKVKDLDLAIKTENFRAMNTPEMSATMDADVALRGTPALPRMSGKLEFTEFAYRPPPLLQYQGTSWEKEDRTIRVKGEDVGEPGQSPWLDRCDLAFSVKIPTNRGLVRSAELNLPFGGNLSLKKPPGGFFLIFGRIEAREGWLIFQGKPFRVERGNFVFPAIPAIDPDLDILASYRAGAYTTYLKMGGTLSAPTLEIYSDPALEQADVLSVILFGRPISELAAGQRETLAATGGQVVASYAASGLANSLSDALRLDALIVNPGESIDNTGLGFGKYLNQRLYVFYYHQFGQEAADEFRLRYDVYKNIYVEAGQDKTGQGSADVFFSYPY